MTTNGFRPESLESLLADVVRCARDMWLCGWAEDGAGNMSVRVAPGLVKGREDLRGGSPWVPLEQGVPGLAGAFLLLTATGSMFRRLRDDPAAGCGIIEMDDQGASYRVVWGYEPNGAPSSEMGAHLAVHEVRSSRERKAPDLAVVHVHAPNLVALTCALGLNTMTLTRLLWSVHAECVVLFPEGVEVAAWCVPGSEDLSRATARALAARRMVVWPFHGVAAAGRSPDEAVGFLETGEKAAGIYLKALAAGGPGAVLGTEDLREIAAKFGVRPDETILHGPEPDPHPEGRRRTEEPS